VEVHLPALGLSKFLWFSVSFIAFVSSVISSSPPWQFCFLDIAGVFEIFCSFFLVSFFDVSFFIIPCWD